MDKNKLLPGAGETNKGGAIVLAKDSIVPRTRRSIVKRSALIKKPVEETPSTKSSKKRLIDINKLVQTNLFSSRKRYKDRFRNIQKDRKEERESLLEKRQVNPKTSKVSKPEMPKTGLLDGVKNYVSNVLMGILFTNIQKVMPVVMSVYKGLRPLIGFIGDMSGKILNGLITFINEGYKAYDQTRKWINQKFGEKGTEKFDELVKKFDQFLTTAVTIGVIYSKLKFKNPRPILPTVPTSPKPLSSGSISRSNASYSRFVQGQANIGDRARLLRRGQIGPTGMVTRGGFNAQGGLRGQTFRSLPPAISAAPKSSGFRPPAMSGWMRNTGKILRALGLYFLFTEIEKDITRGDYKAVTVKLSAYGLGWLTTSFLAAAGLAATATGVGSVPGVAIVAGSMAAGAGVDYGVRKMFGYAQGGQITRNGQPVGGPIRRGLSNIPTNTYGTRFVGSQKSNPGQDIGGRKNLEKIFPNPAEKDKPNAMRVLEKASSSFKNVSSINGIAGAIMGIPIDAIMGQKTNTMVIREIGEGFGSYIEREVNKQLNSIVGFAAGGQIPRSNLSDAKSKNIGKRIGANISMAFASALTFRINEILGELRMQSGKKGSNQTSPPGPPLTPEDIESSTEIFEGSGAERVWNFFKGKGLSDVAVAGILGNAKQESGFNPTIAHSERLQGKPAKFIGIFQWGNVGNGDRWGKLVKWAKTQKLDPENIDTQLKWAWKELGGGYKPALDKIKIAKTPEEAAQIWYDDYEVASHGLSNRQNYAKQFYKKYKGKAPSAISMIKNVPMLKGEGTFIQGNTGASRGDHFHIGPLGLLNSDLTYKGGTPSKLDARNAAYVVAKRLMDKGIPFSLYNYNPGWFYDGGKKKKTDAELRGAIEAEQKAHASRSSGGSWGGIDIACPPGTKLPAAVGTVRYYPDGFGYRAQILGTKGFVAHGSEFSKATSKDQIKDQKPEAPNLQTVQQQQLAGLQGITAGVNRGVFYDPAKNQFYLKGGTLGGLLNTALKVTDTENTEYRSLPSFLGKGKKQGEVKVGPDGNLYKWDGKFWKTVQFEGKGGGGNASLPSQSPISAQIAFNPLPLDSSAIKQTPSYDQSTKEVIIMRQTTIVREPALA